MVRLLIVLCLLAAACTPSTNSSSSTDSTASVNEVAAVAAELEFRFESQTFLSKPFPFDVTDTVAMKAMFSSYPGNAYGRDNKDGSPWYRVYYLENESFSLSYYDFFDTNEKRIHYDGALTSDPDVVFSQGIRVGMSKPDFMRVFKLSGDSVSRATKITAAAGEDVAVFRFDGDTLKSVNLNYSYINLPSTLSSFAGNWTSITENEGEGMVEQFQECNPLHYSLSAGTVANDEAEEVDLLIIGDEYDERVDTIEWIRRQPEGLVISARNSANNVAYEIDVIMKDERWMTAEWDQRLFMVSDLAVQLMKFPCEDE